MTAGGPPATSPAADVGATGNCHSEQPILFECEGERLLGILHSAPGDTGVLIVVGGPQYRVGSHRYFVRVARCLAKAGYPALRFDVRGMGDSSGDLCGFEQITADIGAAIDALLAKQPQVRRVVLWGLCDGASAALLYLHDRSDARVSGLFLLNPWVRSQQSLARTRVKHYYRRRLVNREFWIKLFSGKVAISALAGLWRNVRVAATTGAGTRLASVFQTRMAAAWRDFDGFICLVLSGNDYTAKEFLEFASADAAWDGLLDQPRVSRLDLPHADHTLSDQDAQLAMQAALLNWLRNLVPGNSVTSRFTGDCGG